MKHFYLGKRVTESQNKVIFQMTTKMPYINTPCNRSEDMDTAGQREVFGGAVLRTCVWRAVCFEGVCLESHVLTYLPP